METPKEDAKIRSTKWSMTINNPTDDDFARIKQAPSFIKWTKFQQEVGEEGTPHIQAAVLTAQVRLSQMKKWQPRAHFEPAKNWEALLRYVEKTETAVAGTQQTVQGGYIAMDQALILVARYGCNMLEWLMESDRTEQEVTQWKKQEYWAAVNGILMDRPDLVGLYTQPQMERAWVNTRSVWMKLKSTDKYNGTPSTQDGSESASDDIESSSIGSTGSSREIWRGEA